MSRTLVTDVTDQQSRLMPCQRGHKLAVGWLCLGALLLTVGCETREQRLLPFDGFRYKAKAAAIDKKVSRADFTATIWAVSQSLTGAREAGRYEATKYCIKEYGTSRIKWIVGPDTAPENYRIVDDTLTFSGKCDP
ncbi:MAG: hypothetical protein L3J36_01835 [Rhodobacteraceae bacterium]|nr:hypothetical protein [Paracoccaceae bacterium]